MVTRALFVDFNIMALALLPWRSPVELGPTNHVSPVQGDNRDSKLPRLLDQTAIGGPSTYHGVRAVQLLPSWITVVRKLGTDARSESYDTGRGPGGLSDWVKRPRGRGVRGSCQNSTTRAISHPQKGNVHWLCSLYSAVPPSRKTSTATTVDE